MKTLLGLGCVLVFALIGCDDGSGGVSRPTIRTSQGNLCDQIAAVACYDLYSCCSEGEIENFLNVSDPRTADECHHDVQIRCERQIAPLVDAIDNKRVDLQTKSLDDCLTAILAPANTCASVDTMLPWAQACMESVYVGLVPAGMQCRASYECMGAEDGMSTCAQNETCKALAKANESCSNIACAKGLYCKSGTSGSTCQAQLPENSPCTQTLECEQTDKLICDFGSGTCVKKRAGGEACTSDATCDSNNCIPGTCTNSGSTCYQDSNCSGRCEGTNSFCSTDSNCGTGMCALATTTFCYDNSYCTAMTGDHCVFPVKCNLGTCQGPIVCGDNFQTVDYCTSALSYLPL